MAGQPGKRELSASVVAENGSSTKRPKTSIHLEGVVPDSSFLVQSNIERHCCDDAL